MKKQRYIAEADSPSRLIDARIKELGDWRGEVLSPIRSWSRRPTPEWSKNGSEASGLVSRRNDMPGETYKSVVKVTFAKRCSN